MGSDSNFRGLEIRRGFGQFLRKITFSEDDEEEGLIAIACFIVDIVCVQEL